jgi:hypothetical protein
MFFRKQLGDILALGIQLPVDRTPPLTSWPTMKVFDSAGSLTETMSLALWPPRLDQQFATFGVFWTYLQGNYAVGKYSIIVQAIATGDSVFEAHQLEILPGGNAGGNTIASFFHGLPESNAVIFQLDDGTLVRRSNPR